MAGLVANALNKRVVNQYQQYPKWWEPAVTEEDFANLQQVKFITLGGMGDLPTVSEGAAYTELTWDDQTETAILRQEGWLPRPHHRSHRQGRHPPPPGRPPRPCPGRLAHAWQGRSLRSLP